VAAPEPPAEDEADSEDGQLALFGALDDAGAPPPAPRLPELVPIPAAPAHRVRRLSFTSLAEFERCSYRYYVRRVAGLKETQRGVVPGAHGLAATEVGDAVHVLLEHVDLHAPRLPDDVAAQVRIKYPGATDEEIVRIEALAAGRSEMTSVITTVRGGDSMNTVPGEALATIDIRSSVPSDLVFALAELDRDGAYDGVTGEIENRGTWPPMPRTPWLVDLARSLATELGLEVGEQHSGGVSDGCWTGAEGIPTIDGLGPVGGDDHTPSEWIEIETLEVRIELAARLVEAAAAYRATGS
jgi:acetylornithine deacetylase/succinyl-diaminopimelate desuccinylase-like protein